MKFGALPDRLLSSIDLRLPPEPLFNANILPGKRAVTPKAYIGAAVWGSPTWTGKILSPKTPATKYRQLYPLHYNTIELDATHYKIYSPELLQKWAEPAKGKDFKFCPKFPQQISHQSGFKNVEQVTDAFLQSITSLEDQLGPAFLQISENFSPQYKEPLFEYLALLPKDIIFFLEVRHPAWFSMAEKEDLFTALAQLNIGAVITDTPGRRDAAHMHLTLPKLFLRFVCNGVHPTSFTRIDYWIERIKKWVDAGMDELYVMLHPGNDATIPDLADYWVQQLNSHCGFDIKPTQRQPLLF
ncbi:MAG TPA: DUF72 domain-containing protein [Chitinophagaceae bacterium]|nr:DUF72 domain-containing protein [Chitinophagaceae bacterium]